MQNESNRLDPEGWEEEFFDDPESERAFYGLDDIPKDGFIIGDEFEISIEEAKEKEEQYLAELFGPKPGRWETEWS